MNLILNRNFELPADGWHQLAPLGEFPHAAAGIIQVIDAAACTLMVGAFETVKNSSGNFPGLLIDFDHFSLDAAKHSEAAGWITDLKLMPNGGGLFAQIRWSDTGEAAVKGGRYRFLSPVWAKSDCEDLGNDRLRPVRLLNAAVTNDPNLKGILPLSNRNPAEPFDFSALGKIQKENTMQPVIDALLNKLNLPANTAEADLIAAIENMATADETAALTNRADTAESSLADLQTARLEADADAFCEANADLIENRDEVRAQFIENRSLTESVFKNLKQPKAENLTPKASASPKPLHNRDSRIAATRNRDASASESKAVKIRNRTSEIMKTESIGYPAAFRRAEQELSD
jgi:phage I-like protein